MAAKAAASSASASASHDAAAAEGADAREWSAVWKDVVDQLEELSELKSKAVGGITEPFVPAYTVGELTKRVLQAYGELAKYLADGDSFVKQSSSFYHHLQDSGFAIGIDGALTALDVELRAGPADATDGQSAVGQSR